MLRMLVPELLLVIVGVLAVNGNLADDLGECPSSLPRTEYVKPYNDVCLYLITGQQSWNDANSNCHIHGGRLVQIQNQDKQDFIVNTLKVMHWGDSGVWIGATDHDSEGTWQWTDGTKLSYGNWHPGDGPQHGGFLFSAAGLEDCALMRLDDGGRWHDYNCGTVLYHHTSICEYQKVPTNETMPAATKTTPLLPPKTAMPTTATTMPPTTTMPTTTTTQIKTTTFGGIKVEFGTTPQAKKRKAELDHIDFFVSSKRNDSKGGSTGMYIAIGAGSCGIVGLVAAILALVLRLRRRQSVAETYDRTTNSRENPIYDIMHGNGAIPENSFA